MSVNINLEHFTLRITELYNGCTHEALQQKWLKKTHKESWSLVVSPIVQSWNWILWAGCQNGGVERQLKLIKVMKESDEKPAQSPMQIYLAQLWPADLMCWPTLSWFCLFFFWWGFFMSVLKARVMLRFQIFLKILSNSKTLSIHN